MEKTIEDHRSEYASLPDWAKKLIDALQHVSAYGGGAESMLDMYSGERKEQLSAFGIVFHKDAIGAWFDAFIDAKILADAMSAPYPAPKPKPHESIITENVVELISHDECAFDQPCHYGNRAGGHAVYCHNDLWPNSPRKCKRSFYTNGEVRDEDCPGFYPNDPAKVRQI